MYLYLAIETQHTLYLMYSESYEQYGLPLYPLTRAVFSSALYLIWPAPAHSYYETTKGGIPEEGVLSIVSIVSTMSFCLPHKGDIEWMSAVSRVLRSRLHLKCALPCALCRNMLDAFIDCGGRKSDEWLSSEVFCKCFWGIIIICCTFE